MLNDENWRSALTVVNEKSQQIQAAAVNIAAAFRIIGIHGWMADRRQNASFLIDQYVLSLISLREYIHSKDIPSIRKWLLDHSGISITQQISEVIQGTHGPEEELVDAVNILVRELAIFTEALSAINAVLGSLCEKSPLPTGYRRFV